MPKKFDACVRAGGRVRTLKPNSRSLIHVCYPRGGGKAVHGNTHHLDSKGHMKD